MYKAAVNSEHLLSTTVSFFSMMMNSSYICSLLIMVPHWVQQYCFPWEVPSSHQILLHWQKEPSYWQFDIFLHPSLSLSYIKLLLIINSHLCGLISFGISSMFLDMLSLVGLYFRKGFSLKTECITSECTLISLVFSVLLISNLILTYLLIATIPVSFFLRALGFSI